ncbi:MAG: DUF2796 domain-containing protein [Marinobacter sp.]|uniref:ZrgA family zinc uptake protein n=1 Tax=Marinobacter sp. TaxID=50741 RepID=UPI0034A065FE
MIFTRRPLTLAFLSAVIFTPTFAAENPGAHVHGQASMQVALEGERIDVIFETPADNLVGFEYEPKTEAERKAVEDARQWLTSTPLVNTAASDCRVDQASVSTSHDNHKDHRNHDDHGKHEDEAHPDGHGHHQKEAESHSEFEVSQRLICDGIEDANVVTPLLTKYPSITALSIDWVTENSQSNIRLEAGETRISLDR